MTSFFSTPPFRRNISLSSCLTSDDNDGVAEPISPNDVATVASAPARPTSPGDRSPSVRFTARRESRRRVASVPSTGHTERPGNLISPKPRTVQQYILESDEANQKSNHLRRLMAGSPSSPPRSREVPRFSGGPVGDAISPGVKDVFQDAVEEQVQSPAEDDKPGVTTEAILSSMHNIIRGSYNENNKGYAYVYRDSKDECQRFKIGSTDRPEVRKKELDKQCKYVDWELVQDPKLPIWEYKRLERLAHSELQNLRCNFICPGDGIKHREYFYGSNATASEVLERWSRWLVEHEPYDEKSKLKPFWSERLEWFTGNKTASFYFNCKKADCSRRDSIPAACQECLRIGWKVWTEPTTLDKVRYYCPCYAKAIWERTPALPTCFLFILCGRLIGPMILAHFHDYGLRGEVIVTDVVICMCAFLCHYSQNKALQKALQRGSGTKRTETIHKELGCQSNTRWQSWQSRFPDPPGCLQGTAGEARPCTVSVDRG
ncbi:hypothetical protein AnigIFM63604_006977 [Aspergillus niger]|uniref:Bacteriophage T5 Orf172 DNA-binding domain-containing protein n=3 Tax=Aspergillus niger TaxID=5061 RepID=A2QWF2_ASPNC|nr:uncharacterized protein BO96DRAFT_336503 [Aspergillus niger CBS 101883]XP_059601598.1 hypothetical protein An11g04935 [Aspergillus niger]RDH21262.1 hypothetical protein M747DRAFT_322655 [Aspergillus niger ATCC 13496]PYH57023.1 hypothetical protein BO96DRAFT_336503 [Aspergillus niger CBS 101883]CAK40698.1 hypothetical protein An11g04935 [Aspergillus niger]GLA50676.1 hypothetical protein AnigIFM63604_006977 [Aspergillus niger]